MAITHGDVNKWDGYMKEIIIQDDFLLQEVSGTTRTWIRSFFTRR